MDSRKIKSIAEGLLFISGDEGIDIKQLSNVLEITELEAVTVFYDLKKDYEKEDRGITITEAGNTFKMVTKQGIAPYIQRLIENPNSGTLSQAALETLAIIAYKQPITRVEIEEIRGVKTEKPIQTLVSKLLIQEVGRSESIGRAILYGTTHDFLDHFGLRSIKDLPPLPENIEDEDGDLFLERFKETVDHSK